MRETRRCNCPDLCVVHDVAALPVVDEFGAYAVEPAYMREVETVFPRAIDVAAGFGEDDEKIIGLRVWIEDEPLMIGLTLEEASELTKNIARSFRDHQEHERKQN